MRTLSPCRLLVLGRAYFFRFLSLVADFKPRLERLKELRRKQTELTLLDAQADYSLSAHRMLGEEDVAKMQQQLDKSKARRGGRRAASPEGSSSASACRTPSMSSERAGRLLTPLKKERRKAVAYEDAGSFKRGEPSR